MKENLDFEKCGLNRFLSDSERYVKNKSPVVNWSKHLQNVIAHLAIPETGFSKDKFQSIDNNFDRVRFACIDFEEARQALACFVDVNLESSDDYTTHMNAAKKSAETSAKYRGLGNEAYGKKNFADASYLYTLAIIYAPALEPEQSDGSATTASPLALAYGNRSALFFELAQWQNCLVDIDLALDAGYRRHPSVQKLLLRKVDALISLGRTAEAADLLDGAVELKDLANCSQRVRLEKLKKDSRIVDEALKSSSITEFNSTNRLTAITSTLVTAGQYQPSADLSSLSSKLEVRFDPAKKGRYLVAREDVQPGDILAVEFPFCYVLLKPHELSYCHHCCRKLETCGSNPTADQESKKDNVMKCKGKTLISGPLIPCTRCIRVLYCSPKCQSESWNNYHRYECAVLPFLYEIGIAHLALRMLLVTGLDTARKMVEEEKSGKQDRMELRNPQDLASHYDHVYKLVHHSDDFTYEDLMQYTLTAGLLLKLALVGGFFGPQSVEQVDPDILQFAGGILLRHILQLVTNAHSISHFVADVSDDVGGGDGGGVFRDDRIASALYPTISLLNHSCDPNVVATFDQGSLNLLRASKPIRAGEEVYNCYGVHFGRYESVKERRELLRAQYFFDCDCPRCELEVRDGFEGMYFPVACEKCGSVLTRVHPTADTFRCSSDHCAAVYQATDLHLRYSMIQSGLIRADSLMGRIEYHQVDSGQLPRADFAEMERHLASLERLLHRDSSSLRLGELYDRFSRFYNFIGEMSKAREYGVKSATIVEHVYGGTSIELACELVKLSDLYNAEVLSRLADPRLPPSDAPIDAAFRAVTERARDLLGCFALVERYPIAGGGGGRLGDDSCFFTTSHQHLVERLEEMEARLRQPKKSQLEMLLESV